MSDVTCARCREPWDTYHLRHDEPFEVIPYHENWKQDVRAWDGKLDSLLAGKPARERFEERGWSFGFSLYDIRRCPCCPSGAEPADDEARDLLVSMFGDDDDGLAAALEDMEGV